jgi:Ca2+-binding RTX toxin-like protein
LLLGDPGVAAVLSLGGSVIGVEEFSIRAGAGNDLIRTGAGRDNLQGGDGDDTLEGGDGEDVLNGGFGDDLIIGGTSGDWLSGGDGSDRFFYQNSNDGGDTITDFQLDHDYLVVSAAGFEGGLVAGMDIMASGRYVENTTGFATSASGIGQFIFQTSTERLYWDSDGEGGLSEVYLSTISFTGAGSRIQVAL